MKRQARSILSLILAILLSLSIAGCNSTPDATTEGTGTTGTTGTTAAPQINCTAHQWLNANCTHPKTCLLCGTTEGTHAEGAHAYAKTEDADTCVFCGDVYTAPPCEHVSGLDTCPLCNRTALNTIKNVIYIIGDGMGLEHIAAGQMAYDKDYQFKEWQFASVNTDSLTPGGRNQSELTDSAAAGTALATGVVTLNGYVGKDQHGSDLLTVLDLAKSYGKTTGIVTTDNIYGATPGAFSAHVTDRNQYDEILRSQMTSNVDLLCGAISSTNSLDTETIAQNGYKHCQTLSAMKNPSDADKLYCTLDMEGFSTSEAPVKLADATVAALNFLDNETGFVLMIEQAHIDKYSHNNDYLNMVKSVNSLNETVEAILAWLGDRTDTAIVITADHETGDFSVSDSKTLPYSAAVPGYSTVYYRFNSGSHTKSNVGLFIYGADVDIENHSYFNTPYTVKNSDIYTIVLRLIRNQR